MKWVKLYTLEWLEGSIRVDLTPAERSVWADLLAMAGISRNEGRIERSKGIPYTTEELATRFSITPDLLSSTISKCAKEGRIHINGDNTITITNWEKYQFTPPGKEKPLPETPTERALRERRALRRLQRIYPDEATQVLKTTVDSKSGEVISERLEFDGENMKSRKDIVDSRIPVENQCKRDLEKMDKKAKVIKKEGIK